MNVKPREKTLADYLRILRRGTWIILLTTVGCGAAALAVSLIMKPRYEAQASLSVQDPNAALALTGVGVPTNETPLQLALSHASQVTRLEVVQGVKTSLKTPLSTDDLRRSVAVSVDPNSALVDITAHAGNATEAAAIANAFADEDASLTTAETRRQYALQAKQLAKTLANGSAANPGTRAVYLTQLARLQTASAVATPVQINATARAPSGPSSPRPVRNTIAGLLFGLLLGMALVYGYDALDHRLRQPPDVEEVLGHPVVGAIRAEAFGRLGAHSGSSSNGLAVLAPADEESFRVLRQNVRYLAADPLRTVLVTSAVAEEGKSTVAACLAAATAAGGKRALLVECDLRRPVLASRLGLPGNPGLSDYLTANAGPTDVVRSVQPMSSSTNGADQGTTATYGQGRPLSCIVAGTRAPHPTELLASDRFRKFLSEVSEVYDAVILDGAPLLTVADTLEIIPSVAGILVCIRLRQTTRDQARGVRTALSRLPARPVGVVLTGAHESGLGYYGYYASSGEAVATR